MKLKLKVRKVNRDVKDGRIAKEKKGNKIKRKAGWNMR